MNNSLKKTITMAMILALIMFVAFSTSTVSAHFIMGYIDSNTAFSVNLLNEVLPFDLDSKEVRMTTVPNIKGIRIGTYSLMSNTKDFKLYVAHSPLSWISSSAVDGDTNTETTIEYRLYLILGNEELFKDAICHPNPSNLLSDVIDLTDEQNNEDDTYITLSGNDSDVWPASVAGILAIVNQSVYLRLEVPGDTDGSLTAERIENLKAGNYVSDVYFFLEATV